jgi:D-alanyl-D-alanine carboxypeptidase
MIWEGSSGRTAHDAATLMRVDDSFEIASITKTFTAALVLQLVEENAIALDTPAARLVPDIFENLLVVNGQDRSGEITVRQLLGHTSGLPDYWTDPPFVAHDENAFLQAFLANPDRLWNAREIVSYARALRPIARPGQRYHYSDTGYVILGLLVERVTGKPFHEALRERILTRLDLSETFLSYRESLPTPRRAVARYEDQLDVSRQQRQSADWAGGGLVSTTRDLGRLAVGLARGGVFRDQSTWGAMTTWHSTYTEDIDYGLGLFRVALGTRSGELWGHDGHGNAFMYYWPERGLVFTGTLNQTQNDWWPLLLAAMGAIDDAGG